MERPMLRLARSVFFADERLPLELIRRDPQAPFPLHTHEFSELVIVLSGSGTHFTASGEHTVSAGDAFVVEGRTAHGYRGVNELVLVNILFDSDRLPVPESDLRRIPGYRDAGVLDSPHPGDQDAWPPLRLSGEQLAHVEGFIDELERECREKQPGHRSLATASFMQIVGFLTRCSAEPEPPPTRSAFGVADTIRFIERNLEHRVRMEELVTRSRMSESSLLRAFKKTAGVSPLQYHLRLRIERACELLARPELSITEVSYRCGFSDSNYFSRRFRKAKDRTPRQYRREVLMRAGRAADPGRP